MDQHPAPGRLEEMNESHDYLVVFEKGDENWSAYSPDVPGCIATGATREEVETLFAEALAFHLDGLVRHGYPIPEPTSFATRMKVA
jgi:predicted RNase H-like HicB family nuclease